MNIRIFLLSIFAVMTFAVAGSAQHVKVIDGNGNSRTLVPSRSTSIPTIDARPGSTLTVVIPEAAVDRATPKLQEAIADGTTFPVVPCGSGVVATRFATKKKVEVRVRIELEHTLVSSYSISGHTGSCRLLTVRSMVGQGRAVKIRFVQ